MLPEQTETTQVPEYSPDLFAEPRDHANQWDVSAFWAEPMVQFIEEVRAVNSQQ